MKNSEFLDWIADRFVYVYKESENVDFVLKLRELADREERIEEEQISMEDEL